MKKRQSRHEIAGSLALGQSITGRRYAELKDVHCWECDVDVRVLTKRGQFLSWCGYVECRVLLCPTCKPDHEMMHALSEDKHERDDKGRAESWQRLFGNQK